MRGKGGECEEKVKAKRKGKWFECEGERKLRNGTEVDGRWGKWRRIKVEKVREKTDIWSESEKIICKLANCEMKEREREREIKMIGGLLKTSENREKNEKKK